MVRHSQNGLFATSDYLALLEYDVSLSETFFNDLSEACGENDVVAFLGGLGKYNLHIDISTLNSFLAYKNITYDVNRYWYYTTNLCMRRALLVDFVRWYYPDYKIIKERDSYRLSWYHERMFSAYISTFPLRIRQIKGLKHLFKRSHMRNVNRSTVL